MPSPDPRGSLAREATAERHLVRVVRGGAIGLVGAVVSAGAGFALVLVVTRLFPPETAGVFFSATSLFLILLALATLGTDAGLARFVLRYAKQQQGTDIPLVLRAALRPVVVISTLFAVILFAASDILAPLLGLTGNGAQVLRVSAIILPAAAVCDFYLAGTRAFGRMRTTTYIDKMFRAGTQPALAAVAYLASGTLVALAVSWAIPYLLAAIVAVVAFRRFIRERGDLHDEPPKQGYHQVRREFWLFTWPRGITRLAQMCIQRADIVIIAALLSPREAAIYTAATRFVTLGQFGTQAISQVLQPRFTALLAVKELPALRAVYKTSTAWSMTLSWPLYIVIGTVPAIYLSLFGEGYVGTDVVIVVALMALAMMIAVFSGPVDTLLLMSGRSTASLVNALVALVLNIVGCFLLIPLWGIPGAALAWGLAVCTRSILAYVQVRQQLSVTPIGIEVALAGSASLAAFAVPLLAVSAIGIMTPVVFGITVVAGGVLYAGLLWAARRPLNLDVVLRAVRSVRPGKSVTDSTSE